MRQHLHDNQSQKGGNCSYVSSHLREYEYSHMERRRKEAGDKPLYLSAGRLSDSDTMIFIYEFLIQSSG